MLKNKVIAENKDLQAAQKRIDERRNQEINERAHQIHSMNRHQRRAFAKINNLPKIKGIRTDHLK